VQQFDSMPKKIIYEISLETQIWNIWGISTTLKSYKLAWLFNQALALELVRLPNGCLLPESVTKNQFATYGCKYNHTHFKLLANFACKPFVDKQVVLTKKYAAFDFFFCMYQHEVDPQQIAHIHQILKENHLFSLVKRLDDDALAHILA